MKNIFSGRRNKSPHTNEEAEKEATPFFAKENKKPFFNTSKGTIQPKLTVGQPGDKYEKEADSMADAVVNNSSKPDIQNKEISDIQRESLATPQEDEKLGTAEQRMEEDKLVQEKPEIQKMEGPEEEEPVQMMGKEEEEPVQMMEGPEEEEPVQMMGEEEEEPIQMMGEEEEEPVQMMGEEEEEPVQMMGEEEEEPVQMMGEEEEEVQAKHNSNSTGQTANSGLSNAIKEKSGKGKQLPKNIKEEMETSFGTDFSDVNIHTDQDSVQMNKELGAQAFTHGNDVYFNSGKYNPESSKGKHLLAHELTHVVQQGGKKKIQKEAEVDALGNYTNNYIFRQNSFFRRVKAVVSDGPLVDDEIQVLRQYAISRNGTVKHSELLLMAAMRSTANATLLTAHTRGNFILPMASISQVNRDYVVNFNRESIPNDIHALRFRRLMARLGISSESITDLSNEIETRIFEEIEAAGGRSFHRQAESIVIHLMSGSSLEPLNVLNAMNNAASDSTSGDKVMAGITYIVAKEYNHPLASRLLNGSIKVDALIPRVYRRLQGEGDASYQYSTDQDTGKADTLYLPTNLELAEIRARALIIHELTHAQDDFNTSTATDLNTIDLEMNAYRSQSKYVMDEIRNVPSGSAPGWVTSASRLANADLTHYWGFVSAAKRAPSTYTTVLNTILNAAPTSKSLSQIATDLGNSVSVIDTNLRNAIINMTDSRGRNLYNSTSTTRVDGGAGHFFN